jgi:hypothetical protein
MPTTESQNSGMLGNSRARLGFMRLAARTQPVDFLDFFSLRNTDNAFAIQAQRLIDILKGNVPHRIRPNGGLALVRHASNTPPVLASTGVDGHKRGRKIWVQTTDPFPTGLVEGGDLWVQ